MRSMTGYGTAKVQSKNVSIEVSIRTVNGRFLETRFHLPREFVSMEAELKKLLSSQISRGTVDVFVSRKVKTEASRTDVKVNAELAKKYAKAYKVLAKDLSISYNPHLEAFARLPDVLKLDESHELFTEEDKLLRKVFSEACSFCDKERMREGKSLQKDLSKLLVGLEKQI